jgi:hypothetical protein
VGNLPRLWGRFYWLGGAEISKTNWDHITEKDPHKAFKEALKAGILTRATVGDYMYMYTHTIKGDAFKNIWTRQYIFNKKKGGRLAPLSWFWFLGS